MYVFDTDYGTDQDDFLGQTFIDIQQLWDQNVLERWFWLEGQTAYEQWQGSIYLRLRWIHSKIKLFESYIHQCQAESAQLEEQKQDYIDKLDHMQLPFWWMEGEQILELKSQDKHENALIDWANQISYGERKTSAKIDRAFKKFTKEGAFPWIKTGLIMSWLYLLVTLCVCIYRSDFYDLCCASASLYFLNFVLDSKKWALRMLVFAILGSYFVDALWFFAHLLPWWTW